MISMKPQYLSIPLYFIFVFLTSHAHATPGDLDIQFGDRGTVTANIANALSKINALAIQADGKLITAGNAANKFSLMRYNDDGTLDLTFGDNGYVITKVTTSKFSDYSTGYDVALQKDGKIVFVGGEGDQQTGTLVVVRYLPNGNIDPQFGNWGIVNTDIGPEGDIAYAVAIQSDGRIVVAGVAKKNGGSMDICLARYMPDGSLDSSFGKGGKAIIDLDQAPSWANDVKIQPDGKIVITGGKYDRDVDIMVARLNANGSLDQSFGKGGYVTQGFFFNEYDDGKALVIQPDGNIVVTGTSEDIFALLRFKPDGSLDNSFSGDGKLLSNFNHEKEVAHDIALDPNGNILVGGRVLTKYIPQVSSRKSNFAAFRFLPNGDVDINYGDKGVAMAIVSHVDRGNAIALSNDGSLTVAGFIDINKPWWVAAHVRFDANGEVDRKFASGGSIITYIPFGADGASAVALQADNKIVSVGAAGGMFGITRHHTDGTLDLTFGTDGRISDDIAHSSASAEDVAILPDGRILVVGDAEDQHLKGHAIVRYSAQGLRDPTFGKSGVVLDWVGLHTGHSLEVLPDGKFLIGGYTGGPADLNNFSLIRYHASGARDFTFGRQGYVETDILGKMGVDKSYDMKVQRDGKILLVGHSDANGRNYDFVLVRYLANGFLDVNFGQGGQVVTDVAGKRDHSAKLAIQNDGKIIVVGTSDPYKQTADIGMVRYMPDGSLDLTFGNQGKVVTDMYNSANTGYAIVVQPDGMILVGGTIVQTTENFSIMRYLPNGKPDSSFGSRGIVTTDFNGTHDGIRSMVLQSDMKLLVLGTAGDDFGLARYLLTDTCNVGDACDDWNICTQQDTCQANGLCEGISLPIPDDGNSCTIELCDSIRGNFRVDAALGSSCNDANMCTAGDECTQTPQGIECIGTLQDTDGDKTLDCDDECPLNPRKIKKGVCGCGMADLDRDGDGVVKIDECFDPIRMLLPRPKPDKPAVEKPR